jgi:recombination protein RecA
MFGSPETTPGGRALKFYSSVRLDLRKIATLKNNDVVVGNRVKAKVVKNKVAPPFREAEFEIMHNEGISKAISIVEAASNLGILEKTGAWFSYQNEKIGQGRDQVVKLIKEKNKLADDLEKEIRKKIGAPVEETIKKD